MLQEPQEYTGPPKGGVAAFLISLVWIVWLVPSLFLIGWSAYFMFLSVAFTGYSLRGNVRPSWNDYFVSAAIGSIPLLFTVAIAAVGWILWRSARFRVLGLCVILIECLLALAFYENPAALISFL